MTVATDTTLNFTEMAITRVNKMHDRVVMIGRAFGDKSEEYAVAAGSLMHCLSRMMNHGGEVRAGDGELNLYCVSRYGLHYGVEWFGKRYTGREDSEFPLGEEFQICGEWSMHS